MLEIKLYTHCMDPSDKEEYTSRLCVR